MRAFSVKDMVVGDQTIRGISGGERKRLTLAETFVTRVSLAFLDGMSNVTTQCLQFCMRCLVGAD